MSSSNLSLISTDHLDLAEIQQVLSEAHSIKKQGRKSLRTSHQMVGVFFEPSTRTRLSFEMAAQRMGWQGSYLDASSQHGTSLKKGETLWDTVKTVEAMAPTAMVIRAGRDLDLERFSSQSSVPVINAGWGASAHPTQALLDVMTLQEEWGESLEKKKILYLGDVKHSRVFSSHLRLLPRLGASVGTLAPEGFGVSHEDVENFESLQQALDWSDAVYALRWQFERHDEGSKEETWKSYQVCSDHKALFETGKKLLLHPGPTNWGLELSPEVMEFDGCRISQQVNNGVHVRAALLKRIERGLDG